MGLGTKPLVDNYSCQVGSEDVGSNSTLFVFFQNQSKSTDSKVHEHNNSRTEK